MFTGIILGQGRISSISKQGMECRFVVKPLFSLNDVQDGESIAVNGACLSVECHDASGFTLYASQETLSHTTLSQLGLGDAVNLERALALGDRLGGHLVSGHVDCIATVRRLAKAGQSLCCELEFPREFSPEVVRKGSVALDGISLTVNDCGAGYLSVNVIPDTQERTTMKKWRQGSLVNMETDLLGKYVHSILSSGGGSPPRLAGGNTLDYETLAQHGFA